MNHATKTLRFTALGAIAGLAALAGTITVANGQTSAQDAAEAAQEVADRAEEAAIERIDPSTGGASLVVDPSLPQPYLPDNEELPEPFEPGLPPIGEAGSEIPTVESVPVSRAASRMISNPVVQETPAAPQVDQSRTQVASNDPFVIKRILPIKGPIKYGEWFWDDEGVPDGPLVMTVDLEARVLSVFKGGYEIGATAALLGTKKHPTPLGTFPILTKEKDNISEKYNNAPMPWTLRLTWSGIAIHGSPVINGYASHGCIGVPDAFAEKLFAIAKRGDKVVITRGKRIGMGDKII
ncbi:MAG: L,D-transpeptidase family protein [Pseudomonadota bacterium]